MVRLSEDEWDAVQAAPPTSYSLGGSGLDRIATMEPRISDGLGHWWDSSIQDWVNGDGSRYDPAQSYASTPDYTDPFANFDASSPYNSGVGGGALDQINQQYQGGLDYQGDWAGGGVYTDPNSGSTPQSQNLWADGYWWNSRGELWDDTSQSWMSPQQYNDYRQQAYDYSNAQANPQFSPINYEQPGGWWQDYQAAQDRTNYNLQDQRLSDYIAPDEPKGGFWNGVKDAAGNVGSALASQPFVAGTRAIVDAVNPFIDEATGTTREQRINDQLSGNALVSDVTGGRVDLSQLPYGAGYVTDVALAPATYVGFGATGGPGATAWEGVKQIGSGVVGNLAAKAGASDAAENIPLYGDQPAWLRGLEAGAIGGIGAYGALDAAPGVAKAAGPILKDFNASEAGEAFGTGIRRNVPEKRVVIDSAQAALDEGRMAPYPQPMANDRLWFHSTRDMNYDLPDPDMAVGTQTGITQGPGIYMAADPAKSAGNYGNRTFVTEFDGKVLDLTKQVRETDPVFPGGPSWAKIRDDLAAKLEAKGIDATGVRQAFDPLNLDKAQYTARTDAAAVARNADGSYSANGYVYKQALVDGVGNSPMGALGPKGGSLEFRNSGTRDLLGRFKDAPPSEIGHSIVQNHLADEGADALFHHSSSADGDVLIVLNGKAARVVADVKNAPEAVKAGATLKDIKRGAVTQVVKGQAARGTVGPHPLGKEGEWWVYDPAGIQKGRILAPREAGDPFSVYMDGKGFVGMFDSFTEAKRVALGELPSNTPLMHPGIKSFLKGGEEGAVNLGEFAQGAKDVAGFAAPIATRAALGAGVGAAYGEASGMGWEKGAAIGAGVGAGFGVLGQVAGKVAARGVEARLAKNTRPEAADKLISLVKQAQPVRESQQELYSQELGRRAGELAKIQARRGGEQGFYEGMGALKGELPKATFNPVRPSMTADEITGLFNHINDLGNMLPFTKMNAQAALVKVLAGELPTRSEITLLGKAFGEDFAKTLLAKRSLGAKAWETAVDALNLPRTLMTSWDASAPLRQGAILFAGHPIAGAKATGAMIRAMASPKYAELVRQGIENSPNATIYEKMGLYFADTTSSAALSAREEAIMSRLAGKIPGIGGSQRGYTTFLNKLRQDVADNFIAGHPNLSNQELKDFGHVINIMSGRGDLPRFLQDNSAILNAAFAPRYAMSRLQLPVEMVKAALPRALGGTTGAASKELARDVTAFVATGTTVLALGKLAGIWNVELDPRSTDFGKGKMGNTRFDFWAGEQQIARYAAQLIGDPTRGVDSLKTGQRKTSTGQIVDANRLDTIGRWLQTKKSPAVGLATDLLSGKDFVGQPIDLKTKEGIGNQAWQRLAPLFLQDMADAAKLSGNQWRAFSAAPSAFGAGVQSYEDSDSLKRQNWIRDNAQLFASDPNLTIDGKPPRSYSDLSPSGKALVNAQYGQSEPFGKEAKDSASVVKELTSQQQASDSRRESGQISPEQWRNDYTDRKTELRIRQDQIWANTERSTKDPVRSAYYAAIDGATGPDGKVDWDKVDSYVSALPKQQQDYLAANTGLVTLSTPQTQQFKKEYDLIKNSGYFERSDQNWQQVAALVPTWDKLGNPVNPSDYQSYDDWRAAALKAGLELAGKTTEDIATVTQINAWLDKQDPAKGMDYYGGQWKDEWVAANPAAAYQAWKYGYYNPKKEIKAWLAKQFEN